MSPFTDEKRLELMNDQIEFIERQIREAQESLEKISQPTYINFLIERRGLSEDHALRQQESRKQELMDTIATKQYEIGQLRMEIQRLTIEIAVKKEMGL